MNSLPSEFRHYPDLVEIDAWLERIWQTGRSTRCTVEQLEDTGFTHNFGVRHPRSYNYVRFTPEGASPFYGYWQPAISSPSPLLVHVPGYGAEMSVHPDLVFQGYNVLHVSPLGYSTPRGADESRQNDDKLWPVLPETVTSGARKGYCDWLAHCVMATSWAQSRAEVIPDRVSFFGTSQGGGGALLLGSLYRDRGVRCVAADVPFLTNFPLAAWRGAYGMAQKPFDTMGGGPEAWKAIGFADTLAHAPRLTFPVLLTAGSEDLTCPADTIESLFDALPGTRSYSLFRGVGHRYTAEFIPLASAWFRLYA